MQPDSAPGGHTLVFLGGLHRSGTTLLFRMLRDHPMVSGFAGTGAPEDEGQHLQTVYPAANRFGGEGRFGFAPAAHLTELEPGEARTSAVQLFSEWSGYWDLERRVLIEKSPPNMLRMRYLQSLFPDARFVMITRHPLEVALASRKRVGRQPIWSLLRHWFRCHDIMSADSTRIRHYLLVRYEDVVAEPQRSLAATLQFLDLPPATASSQQVSSAPSSLYRERWRKMARNPAYRLYVRAIEQRFEDAANRYGYSMRGFGQPCPVGKPQP